MPWKTLLVDDEAHARKHLRRLLGECGECEIVGEAESVLEADELCKKLSPSLIFLDVQMPKLDGFALLPRLSAPLPAIVFVTAHETFAVRAFEVNAVDYLLKPVSLKRLGETLNRLRTPSAPQAVVAPGELSLDNFVQLHDGVRYRFVRVREIGAIKADGNYTRLYLMGETPFYLSKPLSFWMDQLPATLFARVDRSLLVNLRAVEQVVRTDRNSARVRFHGIDGELTVGRAAWSRLRLALRSG